METQAHRHDDFQAIRDQQCGTAADGLEDTELLVMLGALRRELDSMGSDMRELADENEQLRAELGRLRQRDVRSSRPDVHRLKQDCLSSLEHLRNRASDSHRPSSRPFHDEVELAPTGRDDRMKRMMMVMMLADLI